MGTAEAVAKVLRERKDATDITDQALSDQTKISRTTLARRLGPRPDQLTVDEVEAIASTLGLTFAVVAALAAEVTTS